MVVILQQSTENGNKFVSTVVDAPQDSSYTSSFSLNSQVSISERSAVYKQRIDSLFGRPSPSTSNSSSGSRGEPFHIRIDGKSVSPTTGLMGSHRVVPSSVIAPSTNNILGEENEARILTTSDSDDYSRIHDKLSMVTDSLNHRSSVQVVSSGRKGSGAKGKNNGSNVSSVTITCDDSESSRQSLTGELASSLSGGEEQAVGQRETSAEQIMWRNSNYGNNSPGNSASSRVTEKAFNTIRCSPGGMLKFSVDYLGSVPVKGNTAALQDLQAPLRTLYLNYLTNTNMMTGQLAITSDGLRFEAPKIRLVNPFTTIAVWAAVKFVGRGEPIPNECAFMPLISDPEGQDKSRLFGRMNPDLSSVYHDCITESTKNFKNPPIFACVMREATFSLNCHAFACKCAEDAIVIAANLYQSLVDKMRIVGGKEGESGYGSLNRGSSATQSSVNQNRSSSSASSAVGPCKAGVIKPAISFGKTALSQTPSSSSTQNESRAVFSDSESIAPIRPPRKKKRHNDIPQGNLKRYNSDDSVLLKLPHRRRSFKTGYQGHYIKNKKRVQIHTPDDDDSSGDSLSDSVDQILDRIVNPCGMSFKDLKPAYQELLLKIALTLTQDQVYKKSKHAMKKQTQLQQKLRKKPIKPVCSSAEGTDNDNAQFMNNFFKSISKISLSGKAVPISKRPLNNKPEVSFRSKPKVIPPAQKAMLPSKAILKKTKEDDVPFMSFCSGCACDKCSDKCYCSLLPAKNPLINGRLNPSTPTSCTTMASTPTQHPNCSSAGDTDVPRSRKGCGYDTDSCAESEKCYCSLQRVKSNGLKIYNINLDTETSDTDTNSYDLEPFNISRLPGGENNATIKVDSNERPVEILSYHPSRRLSYCFSPTNFESERRRQNPGPSTGKKQAKKGKDSDASENSHLSKNKVLLITGSNACGQVVYKDSPFNFKGIDFGEGFSRRIDPAKIVSRQELLTTPDNKSQDGETPCCSSSLDNKEFAPERVLSMKKTAEIAAMFTDLKLDPATDFVLNGKADAEELGHELGSIDFETSLGYLP